jgi:antitoxin PrlF
MQIAICSLRDLAGSYRCDAPSARDEQADERSNPDCGSTIPSTWFTGICSFRRIRHSPCSRGHASCACRPCDQRIDGRPAHTRCTAPAGRAAHPQRLTTRVRLVASLRLVKPFAGRDKPVDPPHFVARQCRTWHDWSMDATLVLGQQGRLVIPADIRTALGLTPGDRLHLHVTGRRLVLQRRQDAVAELRALGAGLPKDRSLVEELLADRRLAAEAE